MEKQWKVKIYYIRPPENLTSWAEPDAKMYADISVLEKFDLCKQYLGLVPRGYEMIHMEIIRADMVHLSALYKRFQENSHVRSMMIGDIIQVDDKYYAVASDGFTEIKFL